MDYAPARNRWGLPQKMNTLPQKEIILPQNPKILSRNLNILPRNFWNLPQIFFLGWDSWTFQRGTIWLHRGNAGNRRRFDAAQVKEGFGNAGYLTFSAAKLRQFCTLYKILCGSFTVFCTLSMENVQRIRFLERLLNSFLHPFTVRFGHSLT